MKDVRIIISISGGVIDCVYSHKDVNIHYDIIDDDVTEYAEEEHNRKLEEEIENEDMVSVTA